MFLSLPVEILKHVLEYSSLEDKLNLALCNNEHYSVIKPLMWTRVKLTGKHMLSHHIDSQALENLQYPQELHLNGKFSEQTVSNSILFGFNLSRVLYAIDPVKLTSLVLVGSCGRLRSAGVGFLVYSI